MSKHHNNNNGQNNSNVNEKLLDEEVIQNENTEELGDLEELEDPLDSDKITDVNESGTDKGEDLSSDEDKDKDEKLETPKNKDSNFNETKKVNPVRWISKDIVAVDIVHGKSEVLPEKLRVELIDSSLTEATILSNGKYYRVPKSILL